MFLKPGMYEHYEDQLVLKLFNYFTCTTPSMIAPPTGTPSLLREIWKRGNEWHLLEHDHYNCFGFNIFSIESLDDISLSIFGDSEERQAWSERETNKNGKFSVSCADLSWRAFASFSEFDFLFICIKEESKEHGTVRHIINNCCEEYTIPGGLLSIFETLLDAVEARKNQINSAKSQGLCKSLQRMYSSILTC